MNFLAILRRAFPPTWRLRGAFLTVTQIRYRGFNLIVARCHLARATSSLTAVCMLFLLKSCNYKKLKETQIITATQKDLSLT